jgi:hypothetical protein
MASVAAATAGTLTTFPPGEDPILTGEKDGSPDGFIFTDHPVPGGVGFAAVAFGKEHLGGTATSSEGTSTIRMHPIYSEVTAFGLNAAIETANCDYDIELGTPTSGGWHMSMSIVCSGGKQILIKAATCEIGIGSQSNLSTSLVSNSGTSSAMDWTIDTNITGLHYTVIKDGIGCPLSGTGTFSNGDYGSRSTVTAKNHAGNPVGITIH